MTSGSRNTVLTALMRLSIQPGAPKEMREEAARIAEGLRKLRERCR